MPCLPRLGLAIVTLLLVALSGCGARAAFTSNAAGSMRVQSLGEDPVALSGQLQMSLYGNTDGVETTFMLADAPLEQILRGEVVTGQIVHMELLWLPRPGWTPTSSDATNASIRYIVIAHGEVGVYAGAGFASPSGEPGQTTLSVKLHDASLKLVERTDGFVDLLTPAKLSGTFSATHDPRRTRQAHFAMSQLVTNAFGRSLFVNSEHEAALALRR